MKAELRHWLSLVLGTSLLGCSATVPTLPDTLDNQAKCFAPSEGKANLYVTREDKAAGTAVLYEVVVDGMEQGSIAGGTYFLVELDPGEHTIYVRSQQEAVSAQPKIEAGTNYFFEVESEWGFKAAGVSLHRISEERGRQLVSDGQRAQPATRPEQPLEPAKLLPSG